MPSSRPNPDCLKPPNGVETRTEELQLIERTPVSSARATRSARAPLVVQIDPDEPVRRVVGDADRVGLVGERDDRRDRAEDLLARDPVVVGRLDERARDTRSPGPSGTAPRKSGSVSTKDATVARWLAETSGPISVASSSGSPTRQRAGRGDEQGDEAVVDLALRRGCASARSSPGRRCRRRRTARRPRRARGPRRRR